MRCDEDFQLVIGAVRVLVQRFCDVVGVVRKESSEQIVRFGIILWVDNLNAIHIAVTIIRANVVPCGNVLWVRFDFGAWHVVLSLDCVSEIFSQTNY